MRLVHDVITLLLCTVIIIPRLLFSKIIVHCWNTQTTENFFQSVCTERSEVPKIYQKHTEHVLPLSLPLNATVRSNNTHPDVSHNTHKHAACPGA